METETRGNLILSRKESEGITIIGPDGAKLHIAVVEIIRGKVRLALSGPREYKIFRDELLEKNAEAMKAGTETHL